VKPFIAYVRVANGEGEVGFVNGSRILFGARDYGFGLGMAEIDVLVFDEGQRLGDTALDDMLPTQNRAKNPLFFIVGTPPRPTDNGEVFTRKRTEALAGEADDLVYVEFSADQDATPRDRLDWDQVARANPSFPEHTPRTAILRMWKNLGPDSFWREGYGIWDDASARSIIDPVRWDSLALPPEAAPITGSTALAVKFSADGARVGCAVALLPADGPAHVEAFGVRPIAETSSVVAWLAERWHPLVAILVDGKAGAGDFCNELVAAGVPRRRITQVATDEAITAHAAFLRAVQDGAVTHVAQPGLDAQVRVAGKRKIGAAGGWGWTPITPDGDVTALDAVTLALHGVTTSKKNRGRTGGDRNASSGRTAVIL
jgi:hypothetical protein